MASFVENKVTAKKADGTKYIKAEYIELVEVYREQGKKYPRRRIIWRKNKKDLEKAGWFDKMLLWFSARSSKSKAVSLEQEFIRDVVEWGLPEAVRNILEEAGILEKVRQLDRNGRHKYSVEDVVVGYVTMSFIDACSKLKYYDQGQKKIFGERPQELHQIYRAVRKMASIKWLTLDELKERWGLFKPPVNILLCDFTTIYWESGLSDAFRKLGWSKDGKPDNVQVYMAIVTDDRGIPVAWEIFEGNASEKLAVRKFVDKLSKDVDLREVVFMGDAGLYSNDFLNELRSYGWKVIMRAPRTILPKRLREEVVAEEGWEVMEKDAESGETVKEIKEMPFKDDYRLIAVRDHVMRRKQLYELDDFLEKLGLLDSDGTIKTTGVNADAVKKRLSQMTSRYTKGVVRVSGQEIRINQKRIDELRRWAGVSLFITDVSWDAKTVVKRYSLLRQVEFRWRDLKSGLHVRPVYHRNPEAIKGHFTLKFFALQVAALMEYKLRRAGIDMTWQRAVELLQDVKAVRVKFTDGTMGWVRTKIAGKEAMKVMRALGVPVERVLLSMEHK